MTDQTLIPSNIPPETVFKQFLASVQLLVANMQQAVSQISDTALTNTEKTAKITIPLIAQCEKICQQANTIRIVANASAERTNQSKAHHVIDILTFEIRVPLTVAVGYLELLEQNQDTNVIEKILDGLQKTANRLDELSSITTGDAGQVTRP